MLYFSCNALIFWKKPIKQKNTQKNGNFFKSVVSISNRSFSWQGVALEVWTENWFTIWWKYSLGDFMWHVHQKILRISIYKQFSVISLWYFTSYCWFYHCKSSAINWPKSNINMLIIPIIKPKHELLVLCWNRIFFIDLDTKSKICYHNTII